MDTDQYSKKFKMEVKDLLPIFLLGLAVADVGDRAAQAAVASPTEAFGSASQGLGKVLDSNKDMLQKQKLGLDMHKVRQAPSLAHAFVRADPDMRMRA